MLGLLVWIDLVDLAEPAVRRRMLDDIDAARVGRAKPERRVPFPALSGLRDTRVGDGDSGAPRFPGMPLAVCGTSSRAIRFTGRTDLQARLRTSLTDHTPCQCLAATSGRDRSQPLRESRPYSVKIGYVALEAADARSDR
jgi:hypothetical protein